MFPDIVTIEVFPRLHLGLLSMHDGAPRINGGIGFSIDSPSCTVTACRGAGVRIVDHRTYPLAEAEQDQLRQRLNLAADELGLSPNVEITIQGKMLTHIGLGSGTAIRLAAIESFCLLYGQQPDRKLLITLSGRGGTSGVGISAYFDGGFMLDLGRSMQHSGFGPSSTRSNVPKPLSLPSITMPDWPLYLCVPKGLAPKTQAEEVAFFDSVTPLPPESSFYAAYEAIFGVYGSVAEADYDGFRLAVDRMQGTSWKSAEWAQYGGSLVLVATRLRSLGLGGVGMSSLGPLLFGFGNPAALTGAMDSERQSTSLSLMTKPRNSGRIITAGGEYA